MVTIYALKDDEQIFYIGQTINIKNRMYQHKTERHKPNTPKRKKIKDIFDNGRKLSYIILATCQTKDALNVEKLMINLYYSRGEHLINKIPDNPFLLNDRKELDNINNKEIEILQLLADDLKTKDIAKKLSYSPRTIEEIRTRMKRKAAVKSTAALLYLAYKKGLIK